MSEAIQAHGLRRSRYLGLTKTHLRHLMTATAINVKRLFNWLKGTPHETTRSSRFAKLIEQVAG